MNRIHAEQIPDQPNTITTGGKRKWIYPTEIRGKWQRLRHISSLILLILFYATPWIKFGDTPFLRLSFLSSSFVLFGSRILIYEFYHFVLLALLLVVTLFAASALIGRVWCGYACPQTVFIEQILGRVDRLFEGPSAKRLADSRRPWTWQRILRRIGKLLTYGILSFSFAFTLAALFTGTDLILSGSSRGTWWAIAILTAIAWFDAAYWREQFCHIVCPYARFQGVMQDLATRTIGYDSFRGEPRGRPIQHKAETAPLEKKGDCIDCGLCVRVCPSGIDIRQGATQLECVACARCIDACDTVMTNIGKPKGLIRYDALAVFENATSTAPPRPSILRPRILAYATAWSFILIIGIYQFVERTPFHARVFGTPGAKPWFIEGDRVKNLLSLKVGNQSAVADHFTIQVFSPDLNHDIKIESPTLLGPIQPGEERTLPLLISKNLNSPASFKETIVIRSQNSGKEKIIERPFVEPKHE